MPVIYKPRGKAGEYGELAVNLFNGCDHSCTYCYAPAVTRVSRDKFNNPVPRKGIIKKIKSEVHLHKGKQIFLCFTCDPYCKAESEIGLTRKAIEAIHAGGVFVNILTKGGLRSVRDFDLLSGKDSYGATLTKISDSDSIVFEPNAAVTSERIEALRIAKHQGLKTWVSLEPVLDTNDALSLIARTHKFVDLYKVGKWNYDDRANQINWQAFLLSVEDVLKRLGKEYYIKADLEAYRI